MNILPVAPHADSRGPLRDGEHTESLPTNGGISTSGQGADAEYWHALISEELAGAFLGVTARTMQKMRQRGNGPRYLVLSRRCLRYTRARLKEWADGRLRSSTSDSGQTDA